MILRRSVQGAFLRSLRAYLPAARPNPVEATLVPVRVQLSYFQSPRGLADVLMRIATEPQTAIEVWHGEVYVMTIRRDQK